LNHRVAAEPDLDAVGATLALAFERDRLWSWAFGSDDQVPRERKLDILGAIFRFYAEAALGYGWVRITDGVESVALWIPPGEPDMSETEAERLISLIRERADEEQAERLLTVITSFDGARSSRPPHYFLSVLGTHPGHAGQGYGLGLLAANLAEIDAAGGAPVFLETAQPHNVQLYERFGFRTEREVEVVPGIDSIHMWRD
jgi:GNAT superfamily N-acetyltransferase